MKLTALRRLIREMILIEQTQAPAAPAPAAATATSTSANVPSYHAQNLAKAQAYAQGLVSPLAPVGGYVIQVAGGKVTFASGTILPNGALKAAGADAGVLEKFALALDQNLRSSIKKGHWAISNPTQWTNNVLGWKDKEGKPFLATPGAAKNLQDYLIREMDAMPITIMIADPAVGDTQRTAAIPGLGDSTFAFYNSQNATYVFNLVTRAGWRTIEPVVITKPGDGIAKGKTLSAIAIRLKMMLAAPKGVEHVPRHEFGHADEDLITYFLQQVIARRVGKGMTAATAAVSVADVDETALTLARLGNFTEAVKKHSSDLIRAGDQGAVAAAIARRRPELGNAQTAPQNPAYLDYLIVYGGVLVSLGLLNVDHPLSPFGSNTVDVNRVQARDAYHFYVPTGGRTGNIRGITVVSSSPQAIDSRVNELLDIGGGEPFGANHILDTLKMLQQNLDPSASDLNAAIAKLASDPVASEEASRARVLADLAGPDFFSAVQTVAAADALPQNSSSA
jgi:hypothetical protein